MDISVLKILIPATLAFMIGIGITPFVTHYLYKYRAWKKTGGKKTLHGQEATEFNRLKAATETKTPRLGGIVIWASVLATVALLFIGKLLLPETLFSEIDFFSRNQTWIPLFALIIGAGIGFVNDFIDIAHGGEGLALRYRLLLIAILSSILGWWFYDKLDIIGINIPFVGLLELGVLIIPFFVFMTMALYASGVIDGIDGLSGGVFASIFTAYAGVAVIQNQFDLAALCATLTGAILAFTWFNIPPARFWMTETGSMALTLCLSVVVFMTDALADGYGISLLFIIGLPLIVTVGSVILQVLYRKLFNKKLFRIAPLHHHFEAIGWPAHKVTMRYWVISLICAILGITFASIL